MTIERTEFEPDEAKDRSDIRFDPVLYEKNNDDQHHTAMSEKGKGKKALKGEQAQEREQPTQQECSLSLKTAVPKN
ncbi:hypothetical protein Tcan_16108 [Toxocara canis]|uniref:Uncharacterized protein n=1 Tax=Toxocara canis TaxID=6265 RepID=A0A0B2V0A9_TOXCA|nr:hypothetical protein Tcan_16108 [Toxocara canis]